MHQRACWIHIDSRRIIQHWLVLIAKEQGIDPLVLMSDLVVRVFVVPAVSHLRREVSDTLHSINGIENVSLFDTHSSVFCHR